MSKRIVATICRNNKYRTKIATTDDKGQSRREILFMKIRTRNKVHLVQVWNFSCFISCLMASNSNARMLLTWLGESLTFRSAMVEWGVLSWSTRWCSILEDKKTQEFLRKNMRTSCAEWMLIAKKKIATAAVEGQGWLFANAIRNMVLYGADKAWSYISSILSCTGSLFFLIIQLLFHRYHCFRTHYSDKRIAILARESIACQLDG
jgi:hypothetical protein